MDKRKISRIITVIATIAILIAMTVAAVYLCDSFQQDSTEEREGSVEVYTSPSSERWTVTTEKDPLNLREEPRQDSRCLGKISKGSEILICDIDGMWGNTTYAGVNGWVNLSYCTKGKEDMEPQPEPTAEQVYVTDTGGCYHRIWCSYLHSVNPISLEDAKAYYRPCSRCHPPQ